MKRLVSCIASVPNEDSSNETSRAVLCVKQEHVLNKRERGMRNASHFTKVTCNRMQCSACAEYNANEKGESSGRRVAQKAQCPNPECRNKMSRLRLDWLGPRDDQPHILDIGIFLVTRCELVGAAILRRRLFFDLAHVRLIIRIRIMTVLGLLE